MAPLPPAGMDLLALDDNLMVNILENHAPGGDLWASLAAICCVSRSWRSSLDSRDALWDMLRKQIEGTGSSVPALAASSSTKRRSKRTRMSGKQAFIRAVYARARRSDELVILLNSQLHGRTLTAAGMRKAIKERQPIDINRTDLSGFTVLHLVLAYATKRWFTLAKELLGSHGASANVCDLDGMTPLMVAAANGNSKALKLLIEHGAAANGGLLRRGAHAEGWRRIPALVSAADFTRNHPMARRFSGRYNVRQWAYLYGQRDAIALLDEAAQLELNNDAELQEYRYLDSTHIDAFESACGLWERLAQVTHSDTDSGNSETD